MGAKLGSGGGPIADINVTPLIDVVLVLLVVFMVITPMLESGLPVDLPEATQAEEVNDVGQFIVISVTKEEAIYVEQEEVTGEDGLIAQINYEYRKGGPETASRALLVKADKNLSYEAVRNVLDMLARHDMTSVLVAAANEE